jgi:hypothetical protein
MDADGEVCKPPPRKERNVKRKYGQVYHADVTEYLNELEKIAVTFCIELAIDSFLWPFLTVCSKPTGTT